MVKKLQMELCAGPKAPTRHHVAAWIRIPQARSTGTTLGTHTHWSELHEIILTGVHYPLEDIMEEERSHNLAHMIMRGSHKSALAPSGNEKTLLTNYWK